jgi:hypothetical protein
MGSIIGAGIGLVGSLIGGGQKSSADTAAAAQNLTGYNYLTGGAGAPSIVAAQNNGVTASNGATATQNTENQLLTGDQSTPAFQNYLNSTGYNFQMDQGQRAITGSAAAKGITNSGATAKALTQYGQNLASTTFNNYLGNLSNLNGQQQTTANAGVNAATATGQAGTSGGAGASQATQAGGNAAGGATGTAAGILGSTIATNGPKIANFFGSL